jgi:very-short-patch-repair endonuclease
MWSWLHDRRFSQCKFRRQHPFGPHILDFLCFEALLDIELDGFTHGVPSRRARDDVRDTWLAARGIKLLRFWNSHVRRDKQVIRDAIWKTLHEHAPHQFPDCRPICQPSSARSAGEIGDNEVENNLDGLGQAAACG